MHAFAVIAAALPYIDFEATIEAILRLASSLKDDPTPILWAGVFVLLLIFVDFAIRLVNRVLNTLLRNFNRMLDALIQAQKPTMPPVEPRREAPPTKPSTPAGRRQPKRGKWLR